MIHWYQKWFYFFKFQLLDREGAFPAWWKPPKPHLYPPKPHLINLSNQISSSQTTSSTSQTTSATSQTTSPTSQTKSFSSQTKSFPSQTKSWCGLGVFWMSEMLPLQQERKFIKKKVTSDISVSQATYTPAMSNLLKTPLKPKSQEQALWKICIPAYWKL